MREILFRGKRIDNGKWVYGNLCDNTYGASKPIIITDSEYNDNNCIDFEWEFVNSETVGQYTGLTDKNGEKIFEGDIIKDKFLFGVVKYATANDGFDGMCGFMVDDIDDGLQDYNGFWHQVEVIGNIHDNPEIIGR